MTNDLFIKLDYRCNNSCIFCSTGDKKDYLTFEDFKRTIDQLASSSTRKITISGGEVTLRKDLLKLIQYAREKDIALNIQTNARAFSDEEYTKKVVELGIEHFLISFHAAEKDLFEKITNVSGSYEETIAGIEMLKKYDQIITTNTVISELNYKQFPELGKLLVKLNVDYIKFVFIRSFGYAKEKYASLSPKFYDIQPYLLDTLGNIRLLTKNAMTEGIPFCQLPGLEECVGELYIPKELTFKDPLYEVGDFTKQESGFRSKGKKCLRCNFNELCLGPWREYADLYGFEEFSPITGIEPLDILPTSVLVNKFF